MDNLRTELSVMRQNAEHTINEIRLYIDRPEPNILEALEMLKRLDVIIKKL